MYCIEKLSKLLTERTPDETILIVGNADEGRRLITECAKAGKLLVGVRSATPLMLAQEICASKLARAGAPRLLTKGAMQDLLFRSLREMPEEGFFLKPHVKERKTAEMLLSAISELNRENIAPISGNERLQAVQQLREQWQKIKGDALLDEADLLRMASGLAETEEHFPETAFVVLSTEVFPALDQELIQTVAKDRLTVFPVEVPENSRIPMHCAGKPGEEIRINRERLQFWGCRGIETEQKAIMRDILSAGKAAEDCAIVYMSREYVPGLYAAAKSFHLPITMAEGIPLTDSTVYDVLKLVQTWTLSDCSAEELRKPVLSGALKLDSGRRFCRALRDRNIGWGKKRYMLLHEQDESGFPDAGTADNWKTVLDLLFRASEKSGTREEQKQILQQLLDTGVGVRRGEDAYALATVRNLLEQISWLEEGETVLDRLIDLTEQASSPTGDRETGSILAIPLLQAFCTGRKYLYFCGLSRFSMQKDSEESPIILDEERIRFGLAGKQEKEIRTSFLFLLSLAQHEGEAVLSYNDYDMERMNPLPPSPVFRSLLGNGKEKAVTCVSEEALMPGDLVAAGKKILVQLSDSGKERSGEQAQPFELREEKSFDTSMENMAFSASVMETALSCPFKFYMQRLVGLYPPSIPERRNDSWLEANEMGTLCHAVLERYYRNSTAGWEHILEEEIEKTKKIRPEGPESAVKADTEKAGRMIARAIAWTDRTGRQVIATEKAFGKNAGGEPIEIQIGDRSLKLSGSIDRLDRTKDGTLAILDYKTGGSGGYRGKLDIKLQQYLYTRAEENMEPGQDVTEGGYLFLKDTADYLQICQNTAERAKKERTVESLLNWLGAESRATIAAPAFEIREDGSFDRPGDADERKKQFEKCRKFCEFAALCPAEIQIQSTGKPGSGEAEAND